MYEPITNPILIPLKLKYRTRQPPGFKSKTSHGTPKKKTIWKLLEENYKKRGKR